MKQKKKCKCDQRRNEDGKATSKQNGVNNIQQQQKQTNKFNSIIRTASHQLPRRGAEPRRGRQRACHHPTVVQCGRGRGAGPLRTNSVTRGEHRVRGSLARHDLMLRQLGRAGREDDADVLVQVHLPLARPHEPQVRREAECAPAAG